MKNMKISGNNTNITSSDISKNLLQRHLTFFVENNLEALMADYTNESVLITQDTRYTGIEEIKGYFVDLISHFPKQKSTIELDKTEISDDLAYIVWHGKSTSLEVLFATDTFIIKNGKIYRQTFAGQLKFIS